MISNGYGDRIESHRHETWPLWSPKKMLDSWSDVGAKFAVIPKDFKRVLVAERKALADGLTDSEARHGRDRVG